MISERASRHTFLGLSALLFAAGVTVTIAWSSSMSAMAGMPAPGGWPASAASFLGMWIAMTAAMMLPSLVPVLWRCRQALDRTAAARPGPLTALAGAGYFAAWAGFGVAALPLVLALQAIEMQPAPARAAPVALGLVVLAAGCVQLTGWKARHLACWREAPGWDRALPPGAGAAWRHGLGLGLACGRCCAGLMAILLVAGIANLWVMALVAAAITAERLAPAAEHVARAIGVAAIAAGLLLLARAAGLG